MMKTRFRHVLAILPIAFLIFSGVPVQGEATRSDVQLTQAQPNLSQLNDDQIRRLLIERSIARYSGSCPCPYNLARNGSRCGKRSAYSRPCGAAPLCYPQDISDETIDRFRQQNP